MQFGWVNMRAYNFCLWTKFHHLFSSNVEGVAVDQLLFGFSMPLEHPCLAARRVENFRDVTPTSAKVLGAHKLNFKPDFTCSPLNYFGGHP